MAYANIEFQFFAYNFNHNAINHIIEEVICIMIELIIIGTLKIDFCPSRGQIAFIRYLGMMYGECDFIVPKG